MSGPRPAASHLIESLDLQPHPEGGFFREFFRSDARVTPGGGRPERAALSAIYFFLPAGHRSRWHSIVSDEQWTFLEGDPIELVIVHPKSMRLETHRLGRASDSASPTVVVPGGAWQAARPQGEFTLVTCVVGPAFDFDDFRLISDDPGDAAALASAFPDLADLL
jgi:uncharacterized protein